jgi:hypothetical protein
MSLKVNFEQLCTNFLSESLSAIAEFLANNENLETLKGVKSEEIVKTLIDISGFPRPSRPNVHSVPGLTAPGGSSVSSRAVDPPSAKEKKSKGKGSGRTKVPKGQWITPEEFADRYRDEDLCAFLSPRGQHEDKVCADPATDHTDSSNRLLWRCNTCSKKKGKIEDRLAKLGNGVREAPVVKYNSPDASSSKLKPAIPRNALKSSFPSRRVPVLQDLKPRGTPS